MQLTDTKTTCYHCGLDCDEETVVFDEKTFCCNGCKVVYEILAENHLCDYYQIAANAGISQKIKKTAKGKFSILNNQEIKEKLIRFTNGKQTHVVFFLPQIHCSSCIWLLENLHRINAGIIHSRVDFALKEITIVFNENEVSLPVIAELLTSVGYEPYLNLNDISSKKNYLVDRGLVYKLGIAGFCFGNIMMLSFPEYFSDGTVDYTLKKIFNYLNLALSLPVFFYSANVFYLSAWAGIKKRFLNIDAPIVLAILITFIRSVYEILSGTGAGYLDSMTGIVFFMLIGRYLQNKTYQKLSFDRDYKSYFPIAVTLKKDDGEEENIPVTQLNCGDTLIIRNNELIPADSILIKGKANIDYSFVTGESDPVQKSIGENIYAGGKQVGSAIELKITRNVSNSYLTELWNKDVFRLYEDKKNSYIHSISRYFTIALFTMAALTAIFWAINDPSKILNAVSAMLIIACPCALLLSSTFTNGNVLRIFGRNNFYLKNATVIEMLADADTIVFDKTGTITQNGQSMVNYVGVDLSEGQQQLIRSVVLQSVHPHSKAISAFLPKFNTLTVESLVELPGKGIQAEIKGNIIRVGSADFAGATQLSEVKTGKTYVSINEQFLGVFSISNQYRKGLVPLIGELRGQYKMSLISGDNDAEKGALTQLFETKNELLFNQTPESKLNYIKNLQRNGKNVMMIGDGLNDAGALKQSNVGIAVSDEVNNFSPACDAILAGGELIKLSSLIRYAKSAKSIVMISFIISILYNIVGLSFAVQGTLSPVIAAILMPASSISIILFTTGASAFMAKIKGLK
ncbi:heavy metal translocating P-type ATPase [Solitalea lacus]|uniref:heavy metal translocating P-type ATPase n=1 Tax=Solitalea lacus TaxID=2911172 RepID=UPI001EDAEA8C|nr:heavy metal translocating P-type ATPase metal-binding domain-containing protein [Solitalea lacus]UKJ05790.1 heavy metal translocating P-type ATPase metal-binding domain-containing protein [Solitalea lacus]